MTDSGRYIRRTTVTRILQPEHSGKRNAHGVCVLRTHTYSGGLTVWRRPKNEQQKNGPFGVAFASTKAISFDFFNLFMQFLLAVKSNIFEELIVLCICKRWVIISNCILMKRQHHHLCVCVSSVCLFGAGCAFMFRVFFSAVNGCWCWLAVVWTVVLPACVRSAPNDMANVSVAGDLIDCAATAPFALQ